MIFYDVFVSPIGEIFIEYEDNELISLSYNLENDVTFQKSDFSLEVIRQLNEYFTGQRKVFSLPLRREDTGLTKMILDEVIKIPYGETVTYQEIAIRCGTKYYSRLVGKVNHNNKFPLIIPCHRVIGKKLDLVGYNGGIDKKIKLLTLEGVKIK